MRTATLAAALTLAAVGLGGAPAPGQGDGPVVIKPYAPKAGDRAKVAEKTVSDLTAVGGGAAVQTKTTETLAYTETIEAVGAAGRPTKLARQYTKARLEGDGAAVYAYEGKSVAVALGADKKYAFTVANKPLTGADAKRLDAEFNGPDPLGYLRFVPKGGVRVGFNAEVPRDALPTALPALAAALAPAAPKEGDVKSAAVTLEKVYAKAGRRHGVLNWMIAIPATEMQVDNKPVKLNPECRVLFTLKADAVIDGTSPAGTFEATVVAPLAATTDAGVTLRMLQASVTRTVEPAGKP